VPQAKGEVIGAFCLSGQKQEVTTSKKRQQLIRDHYLLNGTKTGLQMEVLHQPISNCTNRC
jgi:hypothetical protein